MRDSARALYRTAILDAAESVFSERGFATARVQEIAQRAGLAVGTIYNYFVRKEDILVALLEERAFAFIEAFAPAPHDPEAYRPRLVARLARLMDYIASHRAFFTLASEHGLFGSSTSSAKALFGGRRLSSASAYERALLAVVDAGIEEGVLASIDRDLLAVHLRHSIRSASQWLKLRPEIPAEKAGRMAAELFLYGATKRPRR